MEEDLKIRKTMEERFRDEWNKVTGGEGLPNFIIPFITSELTSLLKDILGKEYAYVSGITHIEDNHVVSVGGILAAAREKGIELID